MTRREQREPTLLPPPEDVLERPAADTSRDGETVPRASCPTPEAQPVSPAPFPYPEAAPTRSPPRTPEMTPERESEERARLEAEEEAAQ
ncbi:hypothetical protein KIPB_011509, partial [Kipferlia bialata]|eukprot:g11509.t1